MRVLMLPLKYGFKVELRGLNLMAKKKASKRKPARTSSGTIPTVKGGKIIYPAHTFGVRPYPKKK
jgi:hypothetical protein